MNRNAVLVAFLAVFLAGSALFFLLPSGAPTPPEAAGDGVVPASADAAEGKRTARPVAPAGAEAPAEDPGPGVPGAVLEGVVREGLTRAPVSGALVMAVAAGPDGRESRTRALTDGDGRYRLGGLPPGEALVRVAARDFVSPRPALLRLEEDAAAWYEFALERGRAADLRLLDGLGQPLARVAVRVAVGRDGPAPEEAFVRETDAAGWLQVAGLGGPAQVLVEAEGFLPLVERIDPAAGRRDLRLTPGAWLLVTATRPDGRAVEGVEFRPEAMADRERERWRPFFRPLFDRKAGLHRVGPLEPGTYRFTVGERQGDASPVQSVTLAAGATGDLAVELHDGPFLRVRLVGAEVDKAVSPIALFHGEDGRPAGLAYLQADPEPGVLRAKVPGRVVAFSVEAAGFAGTGVLRLDPAGRGGTVHEVVLARVAAAPEPAGKTSAEGATPGPRGAAKTLFGRVVLADGRGVPGARIAALRAERDAPPGSPDAVSGPDGHFAFEGLADGEWRLLLRGQAWRRLGGTGDAFRPGGEPALVTVEPAPRVSGTVRDAAGRPVAGFDLLLRVLPDPQAWPPLDLTTGPGSFSFPFAGGGNSRLLLVADAEGHGPGVSEVVDLAHLDGREVPVVLSPAAALPVRVVRAADAGPCADVQLEVLLPVPHGGEAQAWRQRMARTDAAGRAVLRAWPGEALVLARPRAGLAMARVRHRVAANGAGEPLTILLAQGGSLAGTVRGADGQPQAGVDLGLEEATEGAAIPPFRFAATSAPDGTFAVEDVPAGDYLLRRTDAPPSKARRVRIAAGKATAADLP